MVAPDPVDLRLLAVVAEAGRTSVTDLANHLGMDVREVAARLAALSVSGLPLIVGVECDPQGIRGALAAIGYWGGSPQQQAPPMPGTPSGAYPMHGGPSGPYPPAAVSGPYPQGTPSGVYPQAAQSGPYPMQQATPSGAYPMHGAQSGPHHGQQFAPQQPAAHPHAAPQQPSPPSTPFPLPGQVAGPPSTPFPAQGGQDPMSTWGPPQSASWARGDQPTNVLAQPGPATSVRRTGEVGSALDIQGLEGEQLRIQLLEVVDPANFLFEAAGYRLQEGERAVVVHTELTNRGQIPFASLPDLYLMLVSEDGQEIGKAPVSLSSRPPYRIGVQPGETAGGHTVYVLPESTRLASVRWTPQQGEDRLSLTWTVED
ncbi:MULTISPECIES: AsnC family transcriptional regulator [Actinoalloteichus]|uniref:AsnC-type helix-turn-helix domain n=1 Tax=Actinoalloteichus fjordicus TaxID=1612552 RepID=A0AAC9PRP5_9PSEU|nr:MULTISPECIES: AsnC family transcriptional regulator [Actinoalloteichus]APU14016.1 AsnC-type helix-turn-helix domain [Actinoalloteichus fjordicus]APU19962.1 AsnC-type helix-turn-helix domain [Actinoalloteichus sp. GBA129-24]